TDARWRVPHFEKMLYDNAQLASVYLEAYQMTGRPGLLRVARETLDYLDREMSDPGGGFTSATDADSPDPATGAEVEGRFFTWTQDELEEVLGGERGRAIGAYFGVTGPSPERSVLAVTGAGAAPSGLEDAKVRLYEARQRRPPPARDDKVIA